MKLKFFLYSVLQFLEVMRFGFSPTKPKELSHGRSLDQLGHKAKAGPIMNVKKPLTLKASLLILGCLVLQGCARYYYDPAGDNLAELSMASVRKVDSEKYPPWIWMFIDNQRVFKIVEIPDKLFKNKTWSTKFPGDSAKIQPGIHKIRLDVTAYEQHWAKETTYIKEFEFEPNHKYVIRIDIPEKVADKPEDDSSAGLIIVDETQNLKIVDELLVLKHSPWSSVVEDDGELIQAGMQGVIIDAAHQ